MDSDLNRAIDSSITHYSMCVHGLWTLHTVRYWYARLWIMDYGVDSLFPSRSIKARAHSMSATIV